MEKTFLFTKSLVDGVEWAKSAPYGHWKDKAYQDLINTLSRAEWTPDAAIQRGLDFENKVYDISKGRARFIETNEERAALDFFVKRIEGGRIQVTEKRNEVVDDRTYCFYGVADVLKKGEIIQDIKTTGSYKPSKYVKGFQHVLYCYVFNETKFEYLVQPFNDAGEFLPQKVESYTVTDPEPQKFLQSRVYEKVRETIAYLKEYPDLLKLYENVFTKSWN